MGTMCGTKVPKKEPVQRDNPQVFDRQNFKFLDYTRAIGTAEDIDALEYRIKDYRPADIRCFRDTQELQSHSYVLVEGTAPNISEDVGLMIRYSEKGFYLTLGDLDRLPQPSSVYIEKVHFPPAEARHKGGFRDIVRWTYEHKDQLYVDPKVVPELNMGARVFDYVKALIN